MKININRRTFYIISFLIIFVNLINSANSFNFVLNISAIIWEIFTANILYIILKIIIKLFVSNKNDN